MKPIEETFEVPVIQFKRPDGRMERTSAHLPISYQSKYASMVKAGCRFEAEVLMTGQVSVTISHHDADLDISITRNGPEVKQGMLKMLDEEQWLK